MAVMRILLGKIAKPRRNNKRLNRTYEFVLFYKLYLNVTMTIVTWIYNSISPYPRH